MTFAAAEGGMAGDLIAFLKARLVEDEQAARAATPGPWRWDIAGGRFDDDPLVSPVEPIHSRWGHSGPDLMSGDDVPVITSFGYDADHVHVKRADAEHIARHDPARVLVEVQAKRRMVDHLGLGFPSLWPINRWGPSGMEDLAGNMLQLLALPYVSHPDYRAEWAPDYRRDDDG